MTTLIFDFDGTVANTLDAIVQISNRLAPGFGLKPATAEEVIQLRDLSFDQLLHQVDVPIFKLLRLLRRVRRELQADIPSLELMPHMAEVLTTLGERGHTLGILTSNSAANVQLFLDIHGLTRSFEFIETGVTVLGKARVIRRVLRQHQLVPQEVIYVGDETRDIDACRKAGIAIAAVTWGFNSRQALARYQPEFLVDHPHSLLEIADQGSKPERGR